MLRLRPYTAADEDAAIVLWQRSWQATYLDIDFAVRAIWWRERWRNELVPKSDVIIAEIDGVMLGFVTIEQATGYLDQIVVSPEAWGGGIAAALLTEAKRLSPGRIDLDVNTDNTRAIRFYRKHGFAVTGTDVNAISGRPVYKMSWRAD